MFALSICMQKKYIGVGCWSAIKIFSLSFVYENGMQESVTCTVSSVSLGSSNCTVSHSNSYSTEWLIKMHYKCHTQLKHDKGKRTSIQKNEVNKN